MHKYCAQSQLQLPSWSTCKIVCVVLLAKEAGLVCKYWMSYVQSGTLWGTSTPGQLGHMDEEEQVRVGGKDSSLKIP